ncbi:alpha/beta hydrolase [Aquabacterium sp. NJ1]|uniref:alpha/beta fold hydrolase n=1 Tax=Aquabacterium sp. NJ1 TaxID=1538295 RepID=UPI00052BA4B6|nr:alpha/beta hydrolase [Aquabacterium sp. NJ1]KGM40633.1 alpha/beta hydrolase [Aquabacterium sp. NJ1]
MKALKIAGGVLALVVALAGVGIVSAWAPDLPVESLKARWAPAPSHFVALNGMQVHLRDEGPRDDPQPIVLLHGTSASLHTWEGWVAALKGQHRVITVDLPGFGLTGPAPDGDYHLPHYADFVVSVLDHLQLKQVVLAGNSLGGEIAWMTAVGHPERVSKLVLVDAGGYPFKTEGMPIGFKIARIPALKPLMTHMLPRHMIESSVRSVYGDPSKVTPELIDRYYELTLREGNRESLAARFSQSPLGAHADQIKQIKQPTLIIWGGQDHLITPDNADKFQHDIAGSRLVVFDKLGHVPQEEDPTATVEAFKAFLAPH